MAITMKQMKGRKNETLTAGMPNSSPLSMMEA